MSTTKFTLGSIFTMVSSTANAGTSMITSVAKGADMLSAFVDKQAKEQAYQYAQEHKVFKEETDVQLALRLAVSAETVNKQKAKSPEFAKSFDHFYAMLKADPQ